MFDLPGVMGSGRTNSTALRYAEWAMLIDKNKSVSTFHFDVRDVGHAPQDVGNERSMERGSNYDSTRLVKVCPTYAYRNRRMTEKDLYNEMTTTSENWEDFRGQRVGDREEETIGSLYAEVLACHGLVRPRHVISARLPRALLLLNAFALILLLCVFCCWDISPNWTNCLRLTRFVTLYADPTLLRRTSSTDSIVRFGRASRDAPASSRYFSKYDAEIVLGFRHSSLSHSLSLPLLCASALTKNFSLASSTMTDRELAMISPAASLLTSRVCVRTRLTTYSFH